MSCLRSEPEFNVQSRSRFPQEGKVVTTARGEEKVLAIDIFRERITLRNVEGETRVVALADFNREVSNVANGITTSSTFEEDVVEPSFEVSPELMYTVEHEIPQVRDHIVMEAKPPEAAMAQPPEQSRAGDRDDSGARRRRGRRGGRRGRGGEQQGES